ncbi:hypothetical protein SM007_27795 [Streptomyces avermitilis]|nr:hypothetical protein SM007_27795 [Streptomyces avermitilis]
MPQLKQYADVLHAGAKPEGGFASMNSEKLLNGFSWLTPEGTFFQVPSAMTAASSSRKPIGVPPLRSRESRSW